MFHLSIMAKMKQYSIAIRPLTANEAARLSEALRETPNILGYRPAELQKFPDALVAMAGSGEEMAGICLIKKMPFNWADIAVLFVFPEFRKQGIGTALFYAAFQRLREQKRKILCVSREPSVIRLMEKEQMRFIRSEFLPLGVQLAYSRHYMSAYRFTEAIRKSIKYPNQPKFRYAIATD